MKNGIKLLEMLNNLIQDEDLTNEKLREASEGLLPNLADYLNGCANHADGCTLIMKERREQIQKHGWTPEADNKYEGPFLKLLAMYLLLEDNDAEKDNLRNYLLAPEGWFVDKFVLDKFDSKTPKERLIIAGALIAAEIDRVSAKA